MNRSEALRPMPMSAVEVADLVSRTRINGRRLAERRAVESRHRSNKHNLTPAQVVARNKSIVEMYKAGELVAHIADATDVSIPHACRIARAAGLPKRPKTGKLEKL